MRAAPKKAALLLALLAGLALTSTAEASLPRGAALARALADEPWTASPPAPDAESAALAAELLESASRRTTCERALSLVRSETTRTRGQIVSRACAFDASLPRFEVESLSETRIWGFAVFEPRLHLGLEELSRGTVTGYHLGLAGNRVGTNRNWLSEDPAGTVDSTNLHAFVGWRPQSATDPLGLEQTFEMKQQEARFKGQSQEQLAAAEARRQAERNKKIAASMVSAVAKLPSAYSEEELRDALHARLTLDFGSETSQEVIWETLGPPGKCESRGCSVARKAERLVGDFGRVAEFGLELELLLVTGAPTEAGTPAALGKIQRHGSAWEDYLLEARSRVAQSRVQYGVEGVTVEASARYRTVFFDAHPELEGKVWVHHSVERQVLTRYPGRFTAEELDTLSYLRGIPVDVNAEVHLSRIRTAWNEFYRQYPAATREQILEMRGRIDVTSGASFSPPVGQP